MGVSIPSIPQECLRFVDELLVMRRFRLAMGDLYLLPESSDEMLLSNLRPGEDVDGRRDEGPKCEV